MFKKNGPDVIDKILNACYQANKDALFTMSLMHQYEERGWLTKKQMQGLYDKAKKIADMPAGWLATLEATIAKLPTRDKTPVSAITAAADPNEEAFKLITTILAKYPQHKAVLALQLKCNQQKPLTTTEKTELHKFYKLLIR